uniref:Uncharacterized protein n=1 Tax=Rhizophora mucronata TaxID=61149 RepID=A0A2P2R1A6_RHIMU
MKVGGEKGKINIHRLKFTFYALQGVKEEK